MGPEGIILVNPPIATLQQSLTHSAMTLSGIGNAVYPNVHYHPVHSPLINTITSNTTASLTAIIRWCLMILHVHVHVRT